MIYPLNSHDQNLELLLRKDFQALTCQTLEPWHLQVTNEMIHPKVVKIGTTHASNKKHALYVTEMRLVKMKKIKISTWKFRQIFECQPTDFPA